MASRTVLKNAATKNENVARRISSLKTIDMKCILGQTFLSFLKMADAFDLTLVVIYR